MLQSKPNAEANPEADILLIGHVTRDLVSADPASDYRIGGTVSFAAITALRLGRRPTVITRAAADTDLSELPSGIDLRVLPSPQTTTFANVYTAHGRVQYCYSQALPLTANDIPQPLRRARAVLLGPLVNEIGPDMTPIFPPETLVAAVPQGWMRRWDAQGRVFSKPWENAAEILPYLDVLVLSVEDIEFDLSRLDLFVQQVPYVVLTQAREGCILHQWKEDGSVGRIHIPPRPAREVDPTGAGDIFTAAFIIRLQETGDPVQAARFANVTASFGVEKEGVAGIPEREQVLAYMAEHPFTVTEEPYQIGSSPA